MKMTNQELLDKIEWEGGVLETLDYGINADNIEDEDIGVQWEVIAGLKDDLDYEISRLLSLLEEDDD